MSDTITAGKVVRLKSGGPDMTVMRIINGVAFCQWFDRKTPNAGRFAVYTLELVRERDPVIA